MPREGKREVADGRSLEKEVNATRGTGDGRGSCTAPSLDSDPGGRCRLSHIWRSPGACSGTNL